MVFLSTLLGIDPNFPPNAKTLALTKPCIVYLMTMRLSIHGKVVCTVLVCCTRLSDAVQGKARQEAGE